jgi:hypothetical protein
MDQLPVEQQILLVVQIVALAALCLRMWLAGLHRVYVYFFGYLVLELLQSLIPVMVPLGTRLYRDAFVASQAFIVAFYALVVLELYSKVLGNLTGIAAVARRYIQIILVLAIGLALLLLGLVKPKATLTGYLVTFERTVMASLVVFILLVTVFLVYYPVPLGRNIVVYLMGYAVFFLTRTTVTLVINLEHHWSRELSSIAMGVSVLCLIFWIMALNRKGETKRVVFGRHWNPADEQKLKTQLDAINASLLRSRRK